MEKQRDVRRVGRREVEFVKVILSLFNHVSRIGDDADKAKSSEIALGLDQRYVAAYRSVNFAFRTIPFLFSVDLVTNTSSLSFLPKLNRFLRPPVDAGVESMLSFFIAGFLALSRIASSASWRLLCRSKGRMVEREN
jgi:hypothetical protein